MNRKAQSSSELAGVPGQAARDCATAGVGVIWANAEYGLITNRPILAGERLFQIEGELTAHPTRYSVQIDHNVHIDLGVGYSQEEIKSRYYWRFMNHHCEPSAMIRGRDVIAVRSLSLGSEVTFDYNTTELEMAEPFDCRCGSPLCLGRIRGFQHLAPAEKLRLLPILAAHLTAPPLRTKPVATTSERTAVGV